MAIGLPTDQYPIELQIAIMIIQYVHFNVIQLIDKFYFFQKLKLYSNSNSNSNIMIFTFPRITLNKDQKGEGGNIHINNNLNNYSDNESVDPEVKELIKGREVLTFGPDAYYGNNNGNLIQNNNISTNTSIIDSSNGFNNLHHQIPSHNQSTSSLTSNTILTNSTSISTTTPISLSMKKIKKFKNLSSNNLKPPNRLKEIQLQILELAQYCGDLDLGTSNRYGDVDSTSIIICLSSANTSSRSSYRSSFRSSYRNTSSSFSNGTDSPASFRKPHIQKENNLSNITFGISQQQVEEVEEIERKEENKDEENKNLEEDKIDQEDTVQQTQERIKEFQLKEEECLGKTESKIIETMPQRPGQALEVLREDVEDELE